MSIFGDTPEGRVARARANMALLKGARAVTDTAGTVGSALTLGLAPRLFDALDPNARAVESVNAGTDRLGIVGDVVETGAEFAQGGTLGKLAWKGGAKALGLAGKGGALATKPLKAAAAKYGVLPTVAAALGVPITAVAKNQGDYEAKQAAQPMSKSLKRPMKAAAKAAPKTKAEAAVASAVSRASGSPIDKYIKNLEKTQGGISINQLVALSQAQSGFAPRSAPKPLSPKDAMLQRQDAIYTMQYAAAQQQAKDLRAAGDVKGAKALEDQAFLKYEEKINNLLNANAFDDMVATAAAGAFGGE